MKKIILVSLVLLVGLVFYWQVTDSPKLVFCNVGQGDAMLLSEGNWQMLLDVGGENGAVMECLGKHVPFWDKTVELVLISHWDKDHCGGLMKLSKYYKINKLISARQPDGEYEQYNYSNLVSEGDIVQTEKMRFEVLSPGVGGKYDQGDRNDMSLVGILYYGNKKILLMGDAEAEVERKLVWRKKLEGWTQGSAHTILKVSHHGSAGGTTDEFLETIRPEVAVISVGKNSYGHPSSEVINRLEKFGVTVKRTDKVGDIVVRNFN